MATSELTVQGLHLFKSLIKDGCTWEGDVFSQKWSELLYFEPSKKNDVMRTLAAYEVGVHFKLDEGVNETDRGMIWVY